MPPREEKLLLGAYEGGNSTYDTPEGGTGDNPVVGVINRDRTGIQGETGVLLREKVEKAQVEVAGGGWPLARDLRTSKRMGAAIARRLR